MRRFLTILTAAAVTAAALQAQEASGGWSLQQCIDHALEHNITLRQQENNVKQQEINVDIAKGSRLPEVSTSAGENFSFGRGLTENNTYSNTNTTSTSLSLGSSVPVFYGHRIRNSIKSSELDLSVATADLQKAREDISLQVAQAYMQILYGKEILDVARNQVTIDSLQVERLSAMLENGKASASQLAQQKAALGRSQYNVAQAQGSYDMALLDLSQLLELETPEGFSITIPQTTVENILLESPESIYDKAVASKPVISAEEFRLEAAEYAIKNAKAAFLPSISLSGGVGTNFYTASGVTSNSFYEQMKHNFSQYLGLSLSVPVFTGFQNRNQVRSTQLAKENQSLMLEAVKKGLYKEIQQAYYNAAAAREQYRSSIASKESARESFDLMLAKYENGKANITEFNEARDFYLEAESDLSRARYEYLFSAKLLDFYAGKPLTL